MPDAASLREAVKPYVKRQKNDAADAEAICEAVTRANMRFVASAMAARFSRKRRESLWACFFRDVAGPPPQALTHVN